MRTLFLLHLLLFVPAVNAFAGTAALLEKEVNAIVAQIAGRMRSGDSVVVSEFQDLDGRVTYFGKYLSNKVGSGLSNRPEISVVDRSELEAIAREIKLQQNGLVDYDTGIRLGKMVGATTIVFGTLSEMDNSIDVNVKIMDVEKGTIKGGVSRAIRKTPEIASLIGTITRSEREKEKDLESQRRMILADVEAEKRKRMDALKQEERQMREGVAALEKKLRDESEIIKEYESARDALDQKQAYIRDLRAAIDRLNAAAEENVQLGMSLDEVNRILDGKLRGGLGDGFYEGYAGKYRYLFRAGCLVDVQHSGTSTRADWIR
jgi:TolB-like protein